MMFQGLMLAVNVLSVIIGFGLFLLIGIAIGSLVKEKVSSLRQWNEDRKEESLDNLKFSDVIEQVSGIRSQTPYSIIKANEIIRDMKSNNFTSLNRTNAYDSNRKQEVEEKEKKGEKQTSIKVVGSSFQLLGGKKDEQSQSTGSNNKASKPNNNYMDDFSDDLPDF